MGVCVGADSDDHVDFAHSMPRECCSQYRRRNYLFLDIVYSWLLILRLFCRVERDVGGREFLFLKIIHDRC